MAILCENALVVTLDKPKPTLEDQQILIDQGAIAEVGKRIKRGGFIINRRIDCSGRIVMPGLVNTHSHLTEILQRSLRDNVRMEIWRGHRARTEEMSNLTAEEIGAAAELACAEMLKNGVTAVVDHFSTRPGLSEAKMKAILQAFERTGIRGVLTPSLSDQDFLRMISSKSYSARLPTTGTGERWQDQVFQMLEYLRKSSTTSDLMLGPSSPFNCSDSLLREVVEMAERHNLGIHMHLLETRLQRWGARKLYRDGLGKRLNKLGVFSRRLSAAHCVWLDEREMDLMASSGASAVHNPASNLKLGSGVAPIVELIKRGVNVSLGTDGGDTSDSYSIFEQMRLAAFLSRLNSEDSNQWVTAFDALRMGTLNGALAIPAWRGKIGKIQKGYRADLVILRPNLRLSPLNDVINQLVFCEGGHSVDTVLVDGKVVVRGGRLTRIREEMLIRKVEPTSKKMRKLYGEILKKGPQRAELAVRRMYSDAFKNDRRNLVS
jgi:5-methylthioadenosine/S-adenosylhomocysteine deaminase